MFSGIQLFNNTVVFSKIWEPEEFELAQCLSFKIDDTCTPALITADLRVTCKRALYEFMQKCFRQQMLSSEWAEWRKDFFSQLKSAYNDMYNAFNEEYLSTLNYKLPLYAHQKDTLFFCRNKKYSLLALEQGTGKTICAASISKLLKISRTIVVCPSGVKWNWFRDLTDVWGFNMMFFSILDASKTRTIKAFQERFIIVNYEMIDKYFEHLTSSDVGHIIVDECQNLKNHGTNKYRNVARLTDRFPDARVTMLSGTPVKNRVNDMFAYLKLTHHHLGKNHALFLRNFTIMTGGRFGNRVTGGKNLDKLYASVSDLMIRKTKEECLDLPDKIINKYYFQLEDYRDEYNKVLAEMMNNKEVNLTSSLHTLNIIVAKSKMTGIAELINSIIEQGRKPLVFSSYNEPLDILERQFGRSCVRIDGSVSSFDRDRLIQQFKNDDEVKVFLGNMIAAGVGINLTNSSDVIFVNFPFTPSDLHQCTDRSHRIGQKNSVNVYYTICEDSIDEHIFSILSDKAEDINALVDKGKQGTIDYGSIPDKLFKKLLESYKGEMGYGEESS